MYKMIVWLQSDLFLTKSDITKYLTTDNNQAGTETNQSFSVTKYPCSISPLSPGTDLSVVQV